MSELRVGVATPEEVQRNVDARNSQPRGKCAKPGCEKEHRPWRASAGMAFGSSFCEEHEPKVPL